MNNVNLYQILEVKPDASDDQIVLAYRILVKKYHPDVWKGDKDIGEKKIREINEAHQILSNKTKRRNYDLKNQFNFEEDNKEQNNHEHPYQYREHGELLDKGFFIKRNRPIYREFDYFLNKAFSDFCMAISSKVHGLFLIAGFIIFPILLIFSLTSQNLSSILIFTISLSVAYVLFCLKALEQKMMTMTYKLYPNKKIYKFSIFNNYEFQEIIYYGISSFILLYPFFLFSYHSIKTLNEASFIFTIFFLFLALAFVGFGVVSSIFKSTKIKKSIKSDLILLILTGFFLVVPLRNLDGLSIEIQSIIPLGLLNPILFIIIGIFIYFASRKKFENYLIIRLPLIPIQIFSALYFVNSNYYDLNFI